MDHNRLNVKLSQESPLIKKPVIPDATISKWQRIVDLMAELVNVPAGLIMKVDPPQIEVFISSKTEDNPYEKGERANLDTGLYCETVMEQRGPLLVPDAREDPDWEHNPDIKLGMVSYLGFPIEWPDGEIFGTICVLDNKKNPYSSTYKKLVAEFKGLIDSDLEMLIAIKEHQEIEKVLQESENELALVFDNTPVVMVLVDQERRVRKANRAALKVAGRSEKEMLGLRGGRRFDA